LFYIVNHDVVEVTVHNIIGIRRVSTKQQLLGPGFHRTTRKECLMFLRHASLVVRAKKHSASNRRMTMDNINWLNGIRARTNHVPRICPADLSEKDQSDWYAGWDFAHIMIDIEKPTYAHAN
jgi:hypothetical protein